MSVVRATSLLHYPALVAELGGDPATLLRDAGLSPADVGKPDAFIPFSSAVAAIESAAATTHTPDFGRQLALRQGIEILGPVGVAARTAATPGDALRIFSTFMSVYSPAISLSMSPGDDPANSFLEFRITLRPMAPHDQVMELGLGVVLRVLRLLLGSRYRPVAVHLPHELLGSRADYVRYFGCPVRKSEPAAGITLRTEDLQRPLRHDAAAHQVLVDYLATLMGHPESDVVESVRAIVRRLLPTGAASLDIVAAQFNLHPKALQRRLTQHHTSFSRVLDEARRDVAEHYLRDTEMNLLHVTRALGYTEQSVLTRSCNRWFGMGPKAFRRASRSATS